MAAATGGHCYLPSFSPTPALSNDSFEGFVGSCEVDGGVDGVRLDGREYSIVVTVSMQMINDLTHGGTHTA